MAFSVSHLQPYPKKTRTQDFLSALKRRDWIISIVGKQNLENFDLWAFGVTKYRVPQMVYDSYFMEQWEYVHPDAPVSENPEIAIKQISRLWFINIAKSSKNLPPVFPKECINSEKECATSDDDAGPGFDAACYSTGDDMPGVFQYDDGHSTGDE